MSAMRRTERIVHIEIDAISQRPNKGIIVCLFAGVKPKVFKQLNPRGEFAQPCTHRIHRILINWLTLWPTEMTRTHHLSATLQQPRNRRHRSTNTKIIDNDLRPRTLL